MSDLANENPHTFFEGLGRFILRIGEVFTSVQNWYEQHADTINAYLINFAKLSIWVSAVQTISEAQIIFTDDLSMDMAQQIMLTNNVPAMIEQYYTENDDCKINSLPLRTAFPNHCRISVRTLPSCLPWYACNCRWCAFRCIGKKFYQLQGEIAGN